MTERFANLAQAAFKGRGVAKPPMVVLPKTEVTEYGTEETIRAIGREAVPKIIKSWEEQAQ